MNANSKLSNKVFDAEVASFGNYNDTCLISFKFKEKFDFKPGQYVWLILPELISKSVDGDRRAFSIADYSDDRKEISILFKKGTSQYKDHLCKLKVGSPVKVIGPFGDSLVFSENNQKDVNLIAGGVGLAPFLALIKDHSESNLKFKLSLKYFSDYIPDFILEKLRHYKDLNDNFDFDIEKHISKISFTNHSNDIFYIVGSQLFVDTIYDKLITNGIDRKSMSFEQNYPSSYWKKMGYDFYSNELEDFKNKRENILAKFIPMVLMLGIVSPLIASWYFKSIGVMSSTHLITSLIFLLISIYWLFVKNKGHILIILTGAAMFIILYSLFFNLIDGYALFWLPLIPVLIYTMIEKNPLVWNMIYLLIVYVYLMIVFMNNLNSFHLPMEYLNVGLAVTLISILLNINSKVDSKYKSNLMNIFEKLNIFRQAIESSSNHIVITDSNGMILFANKSAQNITGFDLNEMTNNSPRLWGGEMDPLFYHELWLKKLKGENFDGEITNRKKNNILYTAMAHISPINVDGKILGYVGTEEDITPLKEINKLKDEFVSLASHELRTPMTAIKGYVSMILDGDYGKVTRELKQPLSDIQTSVERLIHLINDMLNLSRIEAGRIKINLTNIEVDSLIKEVVSSLNPLAVEKKLRLKHNSNIKAIVQADNEKIREVIINLVGNSLKFTDKGSISVLSAVEDSFVKISVIDTGVGIAKNNQDKIFGKFEQIATSAKGKPNGTGLGLYISKMLVQKMGGKMWLEKSQIDEGSVFSFTIPIAGTSEAKMVHKKIIDESKEHPDQKDMAKTA